MHARIKTQAGSTRKQRTWVLGASSDVCLCVLQKREKKLFHKKITDQALFSANTPTIIITLIRWRAFICRLSKVL